jgi:hypothetical protein
MLPLVGSPAAAGENLAKDLGDPLLLQLGQLRRRLTTVTGAMA